MYDDDGCYSRKDYFAEEHKYETYVEVKHESIHNNRPTNECLVLQSDLCRDDGGGSFWMDW